ncbi:MAG: long-chain fatty acid--CoA ligase, partial [Bacteroidota bacterium]
QKHPAALIVPAWDTLVAWASKNEISDTAITALAVNPRVVTLIQNEVDRYNQEYGQWEQIKKFTILPVTWTVDSGELTPTMKLKRKFIVGKFQKEHDNLYSS